MKKFQFSLEVLLTLRKQNEKETGVQLASAVKHLNTINDKLANAKKNLEHSMLSRYQNLNDMIARNKTMVRYISVISSLDSARESATIECERQQKYYEKAHGELKAIEKIREQKYGQFKKEVNKREIIQRDEVSNRIMIRMMQKRGFSL